MSSLKSPSYCIRMHATLFRTLQIFGKLHLIFLPFNDCLHHFALIFIRIPLSCVEVCCNINDVERLKVYDSFCKVTKELLFLRVVLLLQYLPKKTEVDNIPHLGFTGRNRLENKRLPKQMTSGGYI